MYSNKISYPAISILNVRFVVIMGFLGIFWGAVLGIS